MTYNVFRGTLNPTQSAIAGLGERCKLPQRSLGLRPSQNRFWCILALKSDICMVATILMSQDAKFIF